MPKVEHTESGSPEVDGTAEDGLVIDADDRGPHPFCYSTHIT